jgi:hypothetical protein
MAHSLSRPWFWLSRMARISCLFSSKYCSDPWIMIPPPAHTTGPRFRQPKQQELIMHCMETAEDDHTTDVVADHLRLLILQTLTSRNVVTAHAWSIHSSKSSRLASDHPQCTRPKGRDVRTQLSSGRSNYSPSSRHCGQWNPVPRNKNCSCLANSSRLMTILWNRALQY